LDYSRGGYFFSFSCNERRCIPRRRAAWIATRHKVVEARPEVEVVFFRSPQPAPPPPPPAAAPTPKEHKARPKPHPVVQQVVVPPKVVPQESSQPPKEEPPPEDEGEVEGVAGGVVGGVTGGVPGGVAGGIGSAPPPPPPPPPPARMEFNDTMTPPKMISGPNPQYTERALEQEVEGLMTVKCVVTVEGVVRECRVMKSLPFMDRAVTEALERRRYTPALLQGRPIEVAYTFSLRLTLPN
jgi:protein TonB